MRIEYVIEFGKLPTTFKFPGEWINYENKKNETYIENINYKFWEYIFSRNFIECLKINDICILNELIDKMNEAKKALVSLKNEDIYTNLEKYSSSVFPIIKYIEKVNFVNSEFYIDVLNGIKFKGIDYQDIDSVLEYKNQNKLIYRILEKILDDSKFNPNLALLRITSEYSLVNCSIIAQILKKNIIAIFVL